MSNYSNSILIKERIEIEKKILQLKKICKNNKSINRM